MNSKFNYYWLLFLIPVLFISWYFISEKENKPARFLAYFGPKHALKVNDTTYHFIPEFEFTDQDNNMVNEKTVKDKIYVTEFFFTTCQTICPVMNSNLEKVYKAFKERNDFLILSHTVDPEIDSVAILKHYALAHGVNDKYWLFVTGQKRDLYTLARKGYLLDSEQGGPEDFVHTQNFALIDKERHIRGVYDGTDSLEITRLMQDINVLFKEYEYKTR